jgi:GTP-binding protein
VLDLLDKSAVSYAIVLTKADELKASEVGATVEAAAAAVARRPAAFPIVFATSARTGAGLPELRAGIVRVLAERTS